MDLPAHTYRRNSNSVALSCACMGGQPDPLFKMGLQRGDAPQDQREFRAVYAVGTAA